MQSLRVITNAVLALALCAAALYLPFTGSFFLRERWHAETGVLFTGTSLYLLSAALLALAAFAAAVTRAWLSGDITMPRDDRFRPHPDYRGIIIARYWYFIAAALVCLVAAFLLADKVPSPAFRHTSRNAAVIRQVAGGPKWTSGISAAYTCPGASGMNLNRTCRHE
ncbi:MAG: hypothetical protein P8126_07545 [Gammaproteobacteria bacterium]